MRYTARMTQYKTSDLQRMFDVSGETIRTWSNEFKAYLSPTATPGKGRYRIFTDDDLEVFTLIAQLKDQNKTFEEIHLALQAGQRGDLPALFNDRSLATDTSAQVALLSQKLALSEQEKNEAVQRERLLHDKVIELQTQLKFYTRQSDKVEQLREEIGRLKALLEIERERKNDKSQRND